MAVAFDASSESHTGTSGATTGETFSWTHTPSGTPKGVLVFVMRNSLGNNNSAVYYGDYALVPVSGGRAVDTSQETGACIAWTMSSLVHGPFPIPTAATSNTANDLQAVAYGNGYWVAVGNGGTIIYRSTDPAGSWSAATSGTANNLLGVYYENGYWVAVGASGTIVYKATNPTGSWSTATSGTANQLESVVYGGGNWVAVGASGTIRYKSTDPTGSWSSSTSNTTISLNGVTYGNSNWVAVGNSGTVRYTTSLASTWSSGTTGTSADFNSISYIDGTYLVGGTGSGIRMATAPDAASWTVKTGLTTTDGITSVAASSNYIVWAGGVGQLLHFPYDLSATGLSHAYSGTTNNLNGVGYADGYWVAVGAGGVVRYWTELSTEPLSFPTGAQTVLVKDRAMSAEVYAVAITITADYPVEPTGVVLLEEDGTIAEQSVDDGSPGTNSMRFAAVVSGLSDVPSAGANSTAIQSIDFGTRVSAVVRETTAGQGSRAVGFTGTSDDRAAVHLAIREAIVPWTVGVPIR